MPFYSIYLNRERIPIIDKYSDNHGISRREAVNAMRDLGLFCQEQGLTEQELRGLLKSTNK
ncbi:MAG: hypothetical protein NWF01_06690 [Candidatus Bathyarchaeota archaeon]|nr:hypothetical protein [Candidatus Bathyarchaeota archaeon]